MNSETISELAEEFQALAQDPSSHTNQAARFFGVSPERFTQWTWQMSHQIRTADEASKWLELSRAESEGFARLDQIFNSGITPYYLALMSRSEDAEAEIPNCPIRRQGMPLAIESEDPVGLADPLGEGSHSPVKEVVHVYPDRVAFCVAQICPVYCRYCFRKRRDEESGLHFNRGIIKRGIEYIRSMPAIRDVLITGGDPFLASDQALVNLVREIRAIPHVEVIRFGTRTPVTLPYRVSAKLCKALAEFHPIWVNTHFNCLEELTPEAALALRNLADHGFPIGNQAVLLKGVNDSPERMKQLCLGLVKHRVRPYYVFHPHLIAGTSHLRVPVDRGMQIMGSLRGNISGFAVPIYAIDTPSGKIAIEENHILGRDGEDLILSDIRGEIWRERHAFF